MIIFSIFIISMTVLKPGRAKKKEEKSVSIGFLKSMNTLPFQPLLYYRVVVLSTFMMFQEHTLQLSPELGFSKLKLWAGHGGPGLGSQHVGGRGWRMADLLSAHSSSCLFIHSSRDGYLQCFHHLTMVVSACVCESYKIQV